MWRRSFVVLNSRGRLTRGFLFLSAANCAPVVRIRKQESTMSMGKVKWLDAQRAYDFIEPQGGEPDVLVRANALERGKSGAANLKLA
jgi:hypothetical protein